MTNVLARAALPALALAAAAFFVFFASSDIGAQTALFDPCGSFAPTSTAPGESSDIESSFGIGIGPDCIFRTADDDRARYNFGGVVTFTPEEWGVAAGTDLPAGAKIGTFGSDAVLGLFNNTCRTELTVNFDLLNGSIDTTDTISPKPSGEKDRMSPLAEDANSNGVPDGAERWPAYLTEQFDYLDLPSTVHARLYGHNTTAVPGTTVILNFLVFKPGTQVSELFAIDPRLGYPSVTVLNDPTAAASAEDPINDFCAPLSTRATLLGKTAAGDAFRTNPAADGAYPFTLFTVNIYDADGDGIENTLDPCPYTDDSNWNPRGEQIQDPGDKDGDMVPDSCDPFPEVPSLCTADSGLSKTDEDCDGWMNASDNCPLVPNPGQEAELDTDGIGDACDQNPTVPDGNLTLVCTVSVVQIGAGGTPAVDPQTLTPCDPTAPLPTTAPSDGNGGTATPAPTGGNGGGGGIGGGPDSGVGSLSPVGSGVPLWAFAILAAGTIGLLAGIGLTTRTIRDQRREE